MSWIVFIFQNFSPTTVFTMMNVMLRREINNDPAIGETVLKKVEFWNDANLCCFNFKYSNCSRSSLVSLTRIELWVLEWTTLDASSLSSTRGKMVQLVELLTCDFWQENCRWRQNLACHLKGKVSEKLGNLRKMNSASETIFLESNEI